MIDEMNLLGQQAKHAAKSLALASTAQKNAALLAMAQLLRENETTLLAANVKDMLQAKENNLSPAMLDRLELTPARIDAIAQGLSDVAALEDPVGSVITQWQRPNGLNFKRVRVPLGVIAVIYESRPNVTADAGALCLKSGNAVILRGGSDSFHSSNAIIMLLRQGLRVAELDENAIQLVPTTDRAAVGLLLQGLNNTIDVIVPRGGKSLVKRVQDEARVPIFAHLDGNCHVFVEQSASLEMALTIVKNAKLRRTGVCGAAETLLVQDETHLIALVKMLLKEGCEVRGCAVTQAIDQRVKPASEEDYATEFLDKIIAVKKVNSTQEAIDHIEYFGSHHTDAIVSESPTNVQSFFQHVTSAIIIHNASTQFADGGEFGFGAEIGIATGRMHARGPVGVEQLTTFTYHIEGKGQIRP